MSDYDDDYPTCARTHATLRIFRDDLDLDRVTEALGIRPTDTQVKGRAKVSRRGVRGMPTIGGWFLSSDGSVESRDARRHLDWLLDRLEGRDETLARLRAEGCRMDTACYWLSAEGQGGPTLSPSIMRRLGELGIEIWFDMD